MEKFQSYFEKITNLNNRKKFIDLSIWIKSNFPNLETKVAWCQPMFTDHNTYIIGFNSLKNHISIGLELLEYVTFRQDIINAGYECTDYTFKIRWDQEIDYDLIRKINNFSIESKKECKTFWRKSTS